MKLLVLLLATVSWVATQEQVIEVPKEIPQTIDLGRCEMDYNTYKREIHNTVHIASHQSKDILEKKLRERRLKNLKKCDTLKQICME